MKLKSFLWVKPPQQDLKISAMVDPPVKAPQKGPDFFSVAEVDSVLASCSWLKTPQQDPNFFCSLDDSLNH